DRPVRFQRLSPTGLRAAVLRPPPRRVVAIGPESVAVWTEGPPLLVVAALPTSSHVTIGRIGPDVDHPERPQLPNGVQAVAKAHPGVIEPFTDPQLRKARAQRLHAALEHGALVRIRRVQLAPHRPGHGESVIE